MKLSHHIHQICNRNQDGSYTTQSNRMHSLKLSARELKSIGYNQINSARSLKPKHIDALVKHWQKNELSTGTIKNRMSHLRWLAEKVDRREIIAKDNQHYGIADRSYVGENKAETFTKDAVKEINDRYTQASAILQKAYGLRREEAIKIKPIASDRGTYLQLKSSWCKGGRYREIPIDSPEKREAIDHAKTIAGNGSLIPPKLNYKNQKNVFEREMRNVGLGKTHGARHAYAQRRYTELTGRLPPIQGGPSYKDLSDAAKINERKARATISAELGHERLQIVATYIGS